MSGEADHDREVHAFGKQPQAHLDAIRMRFQVIERGVEARAEAAPTALALQGLNVFSFAPLPIPD